MSTPSRSSSFSADNPFQSASTSKSSKRKARPARAGCITAAKLTVQLQTEGGLKARKSTPSLSQQQTPTRSSTRSPFAAEASPAPGSPAPADPPRTRSSAPLAQPAIQPQTPPAAQRRPRPVARSIPVSQTKPRPNADGGPGVGSLAAVCILAVSIFVSLRRLPSYGVCDSGLSDNEAIRAFARGEQEGLRDSLIARLRLTPSCEPCPAHGICDDGVFLRCEDAYIPPRALPWPLSNGVPQCVPDAAHELEVALVASQMVEVLRRHYGDKICAHHKGLKGYFKPRLDTDETWQRGMMLDQLLQAVPSAQAVEGQSQGERLAEPALRDLRRHGEVVAADHNGATWLAATSADMSLACRLKVFVASLTYKHRKRLAMLLVGAFVLLYAQAALRRRRNDRKHLSAQYATALSMLQKQARLHDADNKAPSFLTVANMRDVLLGSEPNLVRRQKRWQRVQSLLHANSNVRVQHQEVMGEDTDTFRWTGPLEEART